MKKIPASLQVIPLLFLAFTLLSLQTRAQYYDINAPQTATAPAKTNAPHADSSSSPRAFLGFGSGINNYVGFIGIAANIRLTDPLLLRLGLGIGDWGTKASVGLIYERKKTNGWGFGLTYVHNAGLGNFTNSMPIDSAGMTYTKQVALKLNDCGTLNFTAMYNWYFHKHNKFYLEFGYSFALQNPEYTVTDGSVLTTTSTAAMNLISPGGIILDVGLMFGLH